ncbi:MAG TPA: type II secretion system F family protein [Isosphaeraceae bacterium]|jgi:type II secretory pathway component PulF|nr:type II secretion system F family protein [Isosphaeraceae bacterium]
MGRDAEDALPPRRPKPKRPEANPPPVPGDKDAASETWRPAQAQPGPARKERREPRPAEGGPTWTERLIFGSVSTAHLANFCRQFGSYLDAGVDLMKALSSLEQQFARTALGPVISRLALSVRRGEALAEAMAREPAAFDTLFINMMRVAEARGGVPETLRRMAEHYEARLRLFRQARSAMIYPVIVIIVASGVIALLTIVVLPIFADSLKDMAGPRGTASLPMPSRVLLWLAAFTGRFGWWLLPLGVVVGFFALRRFYRTTAGKGALDELALYVPVLGKLMRKIDTTRFARTLGVLLDGGVDIGASLDLTADVVFLAPYRRALKGVREVVMEGTELSDALRATSRFDPDVIAIVNSGEETGKLPESLGRLADDYEEQVTYMVKNLGTLVQPLIMIFMGGVVLFIILAVFLPYIAMLTTLSR